MNESTVTYHWALIEYGDEKRVQVFKTAKGRGWAEAIAWRWGRWNLSSAAMTKATVRYLGRSEPRVQY
ncbi:hypothetical protein [Streptomyces sp. NPDC018045]|uniref:hypothetical protein n=1 Tax=Streptomyces sp. NPDC018045 TaxID=3365037 RepID=UPI0037AB5E10